MLNVSVAAISLLSGCLICMDSMVMLSMHFRQPLNRHNAHYSFVQLDYFIRDCLGPQVFLRKTLGLLQ